MPDNSHTDRILMVDDNPTNLQVLFQGLENEDYELLIAQSGEDALAIAREAHPQLILLDINMPGIDGYETCRRLKADSQTADSVVIFLSARKMRTTARNAALRASGLCGLTNSLSSPEKTRFTTV